MPRARLHPFTIALPLLLLTPAAALPTPENTPETRRTVAAALAKGDWAGAERLLKRARAETLDAVWGAAASIVSLRRQGKWEEARTGAEAAAKRHPDDANLAGLLAVTRLRAGDVPGAREAVERLSRGNSDAPDGLPQPYWAALAKGRLLEWDGRLADACRAYARAVSSSSADGDAEAAWLLDLTVDELTARGEPEAKTEESAAWRKAAAGALRKRRLHGHPFSHDGKPSEYRGGADGAATVTELPSSLLVGGRQVDELRVPIERRKDGLYVTIRLADKPIRLQIDSGGGDDLTLYKPRIRGLKLPKGDRSVASGLGGEVDSERLVLPAVAFGAGEMCSVPAEVVDQDGDGEGDDGLLGLGLLRRFQVTLDLARSEMVLRTSAPPLPAAEAASTVVLPFHEQRGIILVAANAREAG